MLNRRELTDKKFWTNCDESVLSTAKTPASLKVEARNRARAGKAKIEAAPTARLGRITLSRVWIWTRALSPAASSHL
jgi:hypothetical protein